VNSCAKPGCNETIAMSRLMCRRHWYQVPTAIRDEVNSAYRVWKADLASREKLWNLESWQQAAVQAVEEGS
jgi:CDP-diacylglycerol pyrophosphatase